MIPIITLAITLEALHPIDLGAMPGASLRGAIYEALAVMYDNFEVPESRHDLETNPVGWLMRLEEQTSNGKDVPRPIAIRPPLENHQNRLTFAISFYGKAQELIPMIMSAIQAIKTIGIGRGRNKVSVAEIMLVDPFTRQMTTLDGKLPAPISAQAYQNFANLLAPDRLTVRFLTPTRIVNQERLCHQPIFHVWFQRLLERIHKISALYAETILIPFGEILGLAEAITIENDQTRWQEGWSHSRLEGMRRPMGGFVGTVSYQGDFTKLQSYLLLGQSLQVGKNTMKGSGWYELLYHWK